MIKRETDRGYLEREINRKRQGAALQQVIAGSKGLLFRFQRNLSAPLGKVKCAVCGETLERVNQYQAICGDWCKHIFRKAMEKLREHAE